MEHRTPRASSGRRVRRSLLAAAPNTYDGEQLVRLYVSGWSDQDLADAIGVAPARVPVLVEKAVEELRARTSELARAALLPDLALLDAGIAEAVLLVVDRCSECNNDEQARGSCQSCGGTGNTYPAEMRLDALDKIARLAERRIRLVGLYKQPVIKTRRP
jgi:hypothetical protein